MEVSIAMHILLFSVQMLQGVAYQIQIPVPYTFKRIVNCQKCIQRFVQHANFTYEVLKIEFPPLLSLDMFANVTDDIPLLFIQQSCIQNGDLCTTIRKNTYRSEEQRKPVYYLRKRKSDTRNDGFNKVQLSGVYIGDKESRDESKNVVKKIRLFGVDLNVENEKEAEAGAGASYTLLTEAQSQGASLDSVAANSKRNAALQLAPNYSCGVNDNAYTGAQVLSANLDGIARNVNPPTYCLLLKKDLFELWIHACLECLSRDGEIERYLISKPSYTSHQWALRYTSAESPLGTAQKCNALCGTIRWGSETDCLVARLYSTAQVDSAPGLAGYHYYELKVEYLPTNKDRCLRCIRSTVTPLVEHTEGAASFLGLTNQTVSLSKFAETCVDKYGPCKTACETKKQTSTDLSNFEVLSPGEHGVGESSHTPPQKKGQLPINACTLCPIQTLFAIHLYILLT